MTRNSMPEDSAIEEVLRAIFRGLDPDQVISMPTYRTVRFWNSCSDQWQNMVPILSSPAVYEVFGISSLPVNYPVDVTYGLEVIGTLANLLERGGVHSSFVDSVDEALMISRSFLDTLCCGNYGNVSAYRLNGPWCDWFIGDGLLDETIVFNSQSLWWILALTDTD